MGVLPLSLLIHERFCSAHAAGSLASCGGCGRQVFHLTEAGIDSGYLSGAVSWEEQRSIMDRLRATPPGIKVLFVTPEKVAASDNLMRLLDDLNHRRALVSPPALPASPTGPCHPSPCQPLRPELLPGNVADPLQPMLQA